jgi:spore photoproduct lyase
MLMMQQSLIGFDWGNVMNRTHTGSPVSPVAQTPFSRIGDGSIITLFDKTPPPAGPDDVVCPHFIELKWANGCNFDCAWCYLNGTFRFRPMGKKPYMKDLERVTGDLRQFLSSVRKPSLLNSGELSDSLVFESNGSALSKLIIPMFRAQSRHKLLIVTKSANVNRILKTDSQEHVVVSFSVNADKVARKWEKKAPAPSARIKAAQKLHEAGYKIRIRLDPIVPIEGWEKEYKGIIDNIFRNLRPERVTLGSLRGLQSTINFSEDKSWTEYLDDSSNWGKKISFDKRHELYRTLIDYLKKTHKFDHVSLCKETVGMWERLGLDYRKMKCNCTM